MNSQRRDTLNAFDNIEAAIYDMRGADIETLSSAFDDVQRTVSLMESELEYLLSEHEDFETELEEWRELGDCPDDVPVLTDAESKEYEQLKADKAFIEADKANIDKAKALLVEHGNLKKAFENQRGTIAALLSHIREVHDSTSMDEVNRLLALAAVQSGEDA